MNKEQFEKLCAEKLTLQEGEFEKLWTEKQEEAKAMGTVPEDLEKVAVNKLYVYFSKQLSHPAEKFEGIILGFGEETDYGASKMYNSIKETWSVGDEIVKKKMVENGEVDEQGNPLWCSTNTKIKWKFQDQEGKTKPSAQRKIDLEREKQRSGILIAKKHDDETYYRANMTLRSDKMNLDMPLFKKVEFRASGKLDEEKKTYWLNSATVTEFVVTNDEKIPVTEITQLVNDFFTNSVVDLEKESFKSWVDKNPDERTAIIINSVPVRISMTSGRSNVINLGNPALGFEDDSLVTCWISKEYDINFAEGDANILAFGTANKGTEGNVSLNTFSFYNPNKFVKPAPVEGKPEEETPTQW